MKLTDNALERLRSAVDLPDLEGTRYRLLEKLGQGGMGGVYRVEDTMLSRDVAMKVVTAPDGDGDLAARLMREAKVIARLEHSGIVPVHDVGQFPDGRVYYTMKLVQGKRLDAYIPELGSIPERLRLLQKICDAVGFAHARGVLHRDLKPQNIMVGPFGEVLVMDWGLSKIVREQEARNTAVISPKGGDENEVTAHGTVLGTPGYMAPEQQSGSGTLDARADVFSLGAILRFLLAETADVSIAPRSRALRAIVDKATAQDPNMRYDSTAALSNDLSAYLDGLSVNAYPEGALAKLWRWAVRNRVWLLMVLAYLVMRTLFILWRTR
ncbi:MAG TPA: serine/threonine-protein kinase [Terriglobales bacterium]|nr:serine/threonine-protein kinase [Terriglobales bacterium]